MFPTLVLHFSFEGGNSLAYFFFMSRDDAPRIGAACDMGGRMGQLILATIGKA